MGVFLLGSVLTYEVVAIEAGLSGFSFISY